MRVMILHHVETMWADAMHRMFDVDYDEYLLKVAAHLDAHQYDRVLLNMFEDTRLEPEHYPIAEYVNAVNQYGYGWDANMFESDFEDGEDELGTQEGILYCAGGTHSQIVALEDWMWELRGHEVYIAGAFDGECIEDLEVALNFLEIPYSRVEELIV
jgi:hypothetical protein